MRTIDELGDHCFAVATEHIVDLCQEMEDALGQKPTVQDLCDLLAWGIKGTSNDLFSDVNTSQVQEIKPKIKKGKKVSLAPGDVIAIPSSSPGKYYFAVYIDEDRFGFAFGVFEGKHLLRPLTGEEDLAALGPSIYSDKKSLQSGAWKLVGNEPDLLQFFPKKPELYHYKKDNQDNDDIGEWGSAEDAASELRNVPKEEAARLGLLDGMYNICHWSEHIEDSYINMQSRLNKKYR